MAASHTDKIKEVRRLNFEISAANFEIEPAPKVETREIAVHCQELAPQENEGEAVLVKLNCEIERLAEELRRKDVDHQAEVSELHAQLE